MAKKFYKESELVFIQNPKSHRFQDLKGQIFRRLTVIGFAGVDTKNITFWFCKCECGNITKVRADRLKIGATNSCGCFNKQRIKETNTTHGHTKDNQDSTTFSIWRGMLARCQNPNHKYFNNYGGRRITVCERWQSFKNFLADMGERPDDKSLDRYPDNNGGYCPENCRWATWQEQNNNRRDNRYLTFNGKTQTLAQWVNELGLKRNTIFNRIERGWPIEKALTTPIKILNKRK